METSGNTTSELSAYRQCHIICVGVVVGCDNGHIWSISPSHHDSAGSGALLVHELVLHLSDGLLDGLGVQPLHLRIIEEPHLTKHLTRDLHRRKEQWS